MVAPSYQSYIPVSEVFVSNGRQYVKMQNPVTGATRTCRWYTNTEYAKLYKTNDSPVPFKYKTQKEVLGFTNGFITIFKKNGMDENYEYFRYNPYRYARCWGWYWPSTEELPSDLPADIEPVRLDWNLVGKDNGTLLAEEIVRQRVDPLIYPKSSSQFQGTVGDRIERTLTVVKAYTLSGAYGTSVLHNMEDEEGNVYVWTTSAKSWPEGSVHHLRGTVKKHDFYRNCEETILTRCKEI